MNKPKIIIPAGNAAAIVERIDGSFTTAVVESWQVHPNRFAANLADIDPQEVSRIGIFTKDGIRTAGGGVFANADEFKNPARTRDDYNAALALLGCRALTDAEWCLLHPEAQRRRRRSENAPAAVPAPAPATPAPVPLNLASVQTVKEN